MFELWERNPRSVEALPARGRMDMIAAMLLQKRPSLVWVLLFSFCLDDAVRARHLGASGQAAPDGERSLFPLSVSVLQHAIPAHIRSQVLDFAVRGLVAMMVAMEFTTLLGW
jgi:hypothetical protein